ncbi:MAG: cobalamin-binding protein [Dehalococcoidales bacterium]|nr:cobalamin-binding protein [Dehalococcoidales bacterium]
MQKLLALSLALILALVGGCAPGQAVPAVGQPVKTAGSEFPLSITDDAGRTVKIEKPAKRIVSLAPSNTEILFALGLGDSVVGVDDYSNYPNEAKSKEKVGSFADTSIEKVVALEPDLVLATNIHVKTVVPKLETRGLATVVVQPKNLARLLDNIRTVGTLAGKAREAETLADGLQRRVEDIANKTKTASSRPRVFFELDAKLYTVGPGTFADDMIDKAGGANIAADAKTEWPQLSLEAIVLKDPDIVFLADHGFGETVDKVKGRPGWEKITAVRNDRVIPLDPDLVNRPGPRAVDGLDLMARALHPESFK